VSAPISASAESEIVLLALFVFIIARRTVLMVQGTRFSPPRLFTFAGLYILLFVALAFATLYAAVVTWGVDAYLLIAPYVAAPAVAALLVAPYVERNVRFEQRPDGQSYYRLTWHIPVLYLVLFVTRFAAEIVVYGPSSAFSIPPPAPPSVAALVVLIAVDLLFAASLGLLVGRGIGVLRAHRIWAASQRNPPAPPSPPLPSR
jgi:hypothetical protein